MRLIWGWLVLGLRVISYPVKKDKQPISVTHPDLVKEAVSWDPKTATYA